MTTYDSTKEGDNWIPATILMIAVILIVLVVVGQLYVKPMFLDSTPSISNGRDHSAEKHGIEIVNAHNNCSEQNGLTSIWKNSESRTLCEVADLKPEEVNWCSSVKKWSCKIIDAVTGEVITTFLHKGSYFSLETYLVNGGYNILMGK